eukprot:c15902_g1_i1.p1 GENE.c15902_g1_i1~~c15902_g1_i1.p1  ORF type:complete len:503 (-),score=116.09 c15902_g1_i1:936-2444(-)
MGEECSHVMLVIVVWLVVGVERGVAVGYDVPNVMGPPLPPNTNNNINTINNVNNANSVNSVNSNPSSAFSFPTITSAITPSTLFQSASNILSNTTGLDLYNLSSNVLTSLVSGQTAEDFKSIVWNVFRQTSFSSPASLPQMFHDMFANLAKGVVQHVGDARTNIASQDQLRTYYRRMLLIWKDILKSDIGNGNPLVTAVVTEWMRDLIPLQVWGSISYKTVNDMSYLMQALLKWAQTHEECVPSSGNVCNVDPIRMQFAVEFMRATMPLVLMGQIKIGLLEKFLASFKRVSKIYPRIGYQVLGLMKANPPLMIHSILHIFSNDGPELDAIRGTSVEWSHSPDVTLYEHRNCMEASMFGSLDEAVIDLCTSMFSNGHGAALSVKSIKLSANSFIKLISCPDDPNNQQTYNCAGNMLEDCEKHCEQDRGQTPNCLAMCSSVKTKKMSGRTLENCNRPLTVKCIRSYTSDLCVNIDNYYVVSYIWGKSFGGADDFDISSEKECPQ